MILWYLTILEDYLKDHYQYVNLGYFNSTMKVLTHGMPQGLILGPILFLVFLNYLPCLVKKSTVDIYTNDITLSTSALFAFPTTVKNILQKDLNQVLIWPSKTKAMLVTGCQLDKKLEDKSTEQVMSEKFLEV